MFRKIFDFSIALLMLFQVVGQPVVSGGYNDAIQMKGMKPGSGVSSDKSLKDYIDGNKVSPVAAVSNGVAEAAPQAGTAIFVYTEDGYWPFRVLPSACHAGKDKVCYTAYHLVGSDIGKGKTCLQKDFPPTAIANGWTTNKDVCKKTSENGEEPRENETNNVGDSSQVFTQEVQNFRCLEGDLLLIHVLTPSGENELMLVNLDSLEKELITENSPGEFLDGAFGEGVCPLILASQVADGLKTPDLVQIRLGESTPEILRWTFTPSYWENLVQPVTDGGVYYTRGKSSPSIYYLEGRGAVPQLKVEDGADSYFATTFDGDTVLAYEVSSGQIAYRFNNEPPVILSNAELTTGSNPVVHPSGSIVFISEGELVYTYGAASKTLASTGIAATDVAFSQNGNNAVIIKDGEAWLYTVQINQSEITFTKKLQITQFDVDGPVSYPDLLK